jgi:hypothetical protein
MASIHRLDEISWPGDCNNDGLLRAEFIHFITCLIKKRMLTAAAVFAVTDNS